MIAKLTAEDKEKILAKLQHVEELVPGLAADTNILLHELQDQEGPLASVSYTKFSNQLGNLQGRINRIKTMLDESQEVL